MKLNCVLICLISFVFYSNGFKVLGVLPFASKSHFAIGHGVVESLLEAGNEVTVISPYPQKNPIKNYTDIDTSSFLIDFKKGFMENSRNFAELIKIISRTNFWCVFTLRYESDLHSVVYSKHGQIHGRKIYGNATNHKFNEFQREIWCLCGRVI